MQWATAACCCLKETARAVGLAPEYRRIYDRAASLGVRVQAFADRRIGATAVGSA